MTNNTMIPSPPSSPIHSTQSTKRKRLSIILPPIPVTCTKRPKPTWQTSITPPSLDTQLLENFLRRGGSLTSENQGRCLLCCACHCHSMEALHILVADGLSRQHLCQDDVSALHAASSVDFLPGLSFLLSDHHDNTTTTFININGVTRKNHHTPLYCAVQSSKPQSVSYLLSRGARLDIPDSKGRFPLHIAILNRDLDCVSLLLDHQKLSKNNPSHTDITWQPKSSISPQLTHDRQCAVEDAVMIGHTPVLERLLQPTHPSRTTLSPISPTSPLPSSKAATMSSLISKNQQAYLLDLAVQWNRVECLELMIAQGYDINYTREKNTKICSLLYKAVQQQKTDMLRILCKADAIRCHQGHNPGLLYAAYHGFLEMVPHLITQCTSNECIYQALTLATPLNNRKQLLGLIIHALKHQSHCSNSISPL